MNLILTVIAYRPPRLRGQSAMLRAVVYLSLIYPLLAHAGLDEAKAAFTRKDYVTAAREFRPLAENGNTLSQVTLGWMYSNGLGVQKDYKEALKWLSKAAIQDGNPESAKAQHNLGVMYE